MSQGRRYSSLLSAVAAACVAVGGTEAMSAPQASGAKQGARPSPRSTQAQRQKALEQGLAQIVELAGAPTVRSGLSQLTVAAGGTWAAPFLERMSPCAAIWDEMLAAAKEGRAGDLAASALKGLQLADGVYSEITKQTRDIGVKYLTSMQDKGSDPAAAQEAMRQMDVGKKIGDYVATVIDTFDVPIRIVLENAPSAVQQATFDAIADALPQAKAARGRFEQLLRVGYARQLDPVARKAAAARLTSLGVAATEPAKAATAGTPGQR